MMDGFVSASRRFRRRPSASPSIPTPSSRRSRAGSFSALPRPCGVESPWSRAAFGQRNLQRLHRIMRMNEAPRIEVHVIQSGEAPGGIGGSGNHRGSAGAGQRNLCGDRCTVSEVLPIDTTVARQAKIRLSRTAIQVGSSFCTARVPFSRMDCRYPAATGPWPRSSWPWPCQCSTARSSTWRCRPLRGSSTSARRAPSG